MLNQVVMIGRISSDIVCENEQATITIAVPRTYKNEDGNYDTDFIKVNLLNMVAKNTSEYCKKGDLIGIKGRVKQEQEKIVIVAERVTFLSSKSKDSK